MNVKRGFVFLVCLALLFSLMFVSAGLFNNKVTGNVIGDGEIVVENPKDSAGNYILISKYYYGNDYTLYAGKYCEEILGCTGFKDVVVKDDAVKACRCDDFWGCPYDGTAGRPPSCVSNVASSSYWERVGSVTCTGCESEVPFFGTLPGILYVDETKKVRADGIDYEITLDGLSSDAIAVASVTINGVTKAFTQGQIKTYTFNGEDFYVTAVTIFRTGENLGYIKIDFEKASSKWCLQYPCQISVDETKFIAVGINDYSVSLDGLSSDATTIASLTIDGITKTFTKGQTKSYVINGVTLNVYVSTIFRTGDDGSGHLEFSVMGGTCSDTCTSLGYECGTHTICGVDADCGTCNDGEECVGGVCAEGESCTDSDGGLNYYIKGECFDQGAFSENSREDWCDGDVLNEVHCSQSSSCGYQGYECPNGCVNGACVEGEECLVDADCEDDYYCLYGGCVETSSCEEGGYFCMSAIDCDGTILADYECSEDYKCCDVENSVMSCLLGQLEVHTCSYKGIDYRVERETQCDFIISYQGVEEEFEIPMLSQVTLKNGVVVKNKEPCGAQTIKLIFEDTQTSCDLGCSLDGKCYPFGYRKAGKYCSDNYEFVQQHREDSVCDNNFECESNVCVNGRCISGSLIQRILEWFRNIFG